MIRKVDYIHKDGPNYQRVFANTTYVQASPRDGVVIDFCEEYIEPYLAVSNIIGGETEYNRPAEVLEISSERKCSITLNVKQAVELAHYIIQRFGQEEKKDDQG